MAISLAVKGFYFVVLNLELLKFKFASARCSQNQHFDKALLKHNSVHGTLITELFRSHFVLIFQVQW
jgi:hypothetical protein